MALRTTSRLPSSAEAASLLAATGERLVDLIRSGLDPSAPAVGHWTVADVAAHLSHVYAFDLAAARELDPAVEANRPAFITDPRVLDGILAAEGIDDVSRINDAVLAQDAVRDLDRLADRIESSLADLGAELSASPADRMVTWLGGVTLPLVAIAGHALFEANGHGTDIARAWKRKWLISGNDVRVLFDGFLRPFLDANPGIMSSGGGRGCIDFRLRGQTRAYFVFDDRGLHLEHEVKRRADLHVSADPADFFLVMAGRTPRARAALRGGILAWGRHPLRGMRLLSTLRSP